MSRSRSSRPEHPGQSMEQLSSLGAFSCSNLCSTAGDADRRPADGDTSRQRASSESCAALVSGIPRVASRSSVVTARNRYCRPSSRQRHAVGRGLACHARGQLRGRHGELELRSARGAGAEHAEQGPEGQLVQAQQQQVALRDGHGAELVAARAGQGGREHRQRAAQVVLGRALFPGRQQQFPGQRAHRLAVLHGWPRDHACVEVKVGSVGSVTETSRSQPSFSSLMCWIATAFALASRSGSA